MIWHPRLKAAAESIVTFAREHWRGLSFIALTASLFCWTNWFFSPQARFERSSKSVLAQTSDRLYKSLEEKRLRQDFGHFGARTRLGRCGTMTCSIAFDLGFRWDAEMEKSLRPSILVSVTTLMQPQFSNLRAFGLLPPDVEWREAGWQWEVTYTSKDGEAPQIVRGSWQELNKIPGHGGEGVLKALAIRMAGTIREELIAESLLMTP